MAQTVKDMTRVISNLLYESGQFWTADNTEGSFEFLKDNEILVNGSEDDPHLLITVTELKLQYAKKGDK